jgi:hypothetical protein
MEGKFHRGGADLVNTSLYRQHYHLRFFIGNIVAAMLCLS